MHAGRDARAVRRPDRRRLPALHRRAPRCSRPPSGSPPRRGSPRSSSSCCSSAGCAPSSDACARAGAGARRLPAAVAGGRRLRAALRGLRALHAPRAAPVLHRRGGRRRVRRLPAAGLGRTGPRRPSTCSRALLTGDWVTADASERGTAGRAAGWWRRTCSGTSSAACARCRWSSAPTHVTRSAARGRTRRSGTTRSRRDRTPSGVRPPADARASWCPGTSRSSWTATAGGPRRAGCRGPRGTRRARRRCSTSSTARSRSASKHLSAYAFSTENWKRSPDEVRFLMGFNRDVIRRRRDELDAIGVRVRWAGRRQRLWKRVIDELEEAEERTRHNDVLTLQFCVNYGGRAEIADAAQALAARGRGRPARPGQGRRAGDRPVPRRAGHARRRPVRAVVRGAADLQLPALAVGVRRDGLPRHAVAGLRPPPPVAGERDLRQPRPPLRRRRPRTRCRQPS